MEHGNRENHELKNLASRERKRCRPGDTLQTTALINEVWIKLIGKNPNNRRWNDENHFLMTAIKAMNQILVDSARSRNRQKRGGGEVQRIELKDWDQKEKEDEKFLALDSALQELADRDPVKADLVRLRYFAGFTNAQAADQLEISTATAERYWAYCRSWLRVKIEEEY